MDTAGGRPPAPIQPAIGAGVPRPDTLNPARAASLLLGGFALPFELQVVHHPDLTTGLD